MSWLLHTTMMPAFLLGMLGAWKANEFVESRKRIGTLAAPVQTATPEETSDTEDETMDEQLSFAEAMEARDATLASVDENNAEWMAEALAAFERCPIERGIGETYRNWMRNEGGLRAPRSPKAWGAVFGILKKRGLIVMTGELAPMQNAASRARLSPVYVKVALQEQAA